MPETSETLYDCKACGALYVKSDHVASCRAASGAMLVQIWPKVEAAEKPAVGDTTSQEKGSGARWLGSDKVPYEFVPLHLVAGAARVFKHVTERKDRPYPMWNWAKGMPWLVPFACMMRHMAAWLIGEDLDRETGMPHLDHAHCNLLMLIHYAQAYPEGDNRPKQWFGGKDAS